MFWPCTCVASGDTGLLGSPLTRGAAMEGLRDPADTAVGPRSRLALRCPMALDQGLDFCL